MFISSPIPVHTHTDKDRHTPQINMTLIIPHFLILYIITFVFANNPFNSIVIHVRTEDIMLTIGLHNIQKCPLKPRTLLAEDACHS